MLVDFFVVLQLVVTGYLTGLIWFVQVVHYPLFKKIPIDAFIEYHLKHIKQTAYVTIPMMLAEAVVVGTLVFLFQRGSELYFITMIGLIALGLIWLSTFGLQLPRHFKLKLGHHTESINILIKSNWIRTILWTIRLITSFITALIFLQFS